MWAGKKRTDVIHFWCLHIFLKGTAIIDNDDFKDDDLTGGETSHRTNMMFIQPESFIHKTQSSEPVKQSINSRSIKQLKHLTEEQHKIHTYHSNNARGAPLPINAVDITQKSTFDEIRKKMFVHAACKRYFVFRA